MSKQVFGDTVENGDLERVAKLRAKSHVELTVDKPLALKYQQSNWKVKKEYTNTLRIYKEKIFDELFEDEIWLLFKKMGFKEMNKDRKFKIGSGTSMKQVDVFAKDDDHTFIIECKSAKELVKKDLKKDIREILHLKKDTIKSLRDHYGDGHRFSFLLLTKNIIWSKPSLQLAKENINKNFYAWAEDETRSYENLTNQFSNHTRYIMYSILFGNRKLSAPEAIKVPAICGGKGGNKYYYFIIQPDKLLNGITYIHRREEKNPREIMYTYQRMLNETRLKKIKKFVQSGGYFANNIILNFTNKPRFDKKSKVGDISYGILNFPRQYGSAWIIDGQHRLYGYLDSNKSETAYLPVIAFDNMAVKDQANLFVDINKEQKPVAASLLWDLYSDIYEGSTDPHQQKLRAISLVSKKLNSDNKSPLYNMIKLPSQSQESKKTAHLTLRNICHSINENRLLDGNEYLLFDENYEKTEDLSYEVIKEYYKTISNSFAEDWKRAEKGLLCSNVGIRIFMNILRQLLKYLDFYESRNIYLRNNKDKFNKKTLKILGPVIKNIKNMTPEERSKIRSESNKALIMENTQKLLWDLKQNTNFGIELWRKGGWTPDVPDEESNEKIDKMLEDTEIELKSFVIQELKILYGKDWWKKGIPSDTQQYINSTIRKDISKAPFKKAELQSLPLDEKLRFASTSHIKDLIIKKGNWEQFEGYFAKDKEIVSTAFKFFGNLRNKFGHPERLKDLGDIEKGLGYWNMQWLRKCIGLDLA